VLWGTSSGIVDRHWHSRVSARILHIEPPQVVPLAHGDAEMPEDVVRRRDMKVEVRDHQVKYVFGATGPPVRARSHGAACAGAQP